MKHSTSQLGRWAEEHMGISTALFCLSVLIFICLDKVPSTQITLYYPFQGAPLVYTIFCVLFVIMAGLFSAFAIRTENQLRAVHHKPKELEKEPWKDLWALYRDTFPKDSPVPDKTTSASDQFFQVDSIMAELNRPGLPVLAFLKSIPGTFTGLGILGTFIGFSTGLTGFDTDNMTSSITSLLSGIQTAFNTSIVGVVMSIVYNFVFLQPLIRRMEHQARELCDELDEQYFVSESEYTRQALSIRKTDVEGKSVIIPPHEALGQISENISQTSRSLVIFNDELSEKLSNINREIMEMFKDTMAGELQKMSLAIEELVKERKSGAGDAAEKFMDALKEIMNQFMEEFRTSMTEGSKAELTNLVASLKAAGSAMESVPATMEKAQNSMTETVLAGAEILNGLPLTMDAMRKVIEDTVNRSIQQQEQTLEVARRMLREIAVHFEDLQKTVKETGGALGQFDLIATKIQNSLDLLAEAESGQLQGIEGMLDAVKAEHEALQTTVGALKSTSEDWQQASLQAAESAQQFVGLDQAIGNTLSVVNQEMTNYHKLVSENLNQLLATFNTASKKQGDQVGLAVGQIEQLIQELQMALQVLRKDAPS